VFSEVLGECPRLPFGLSRIVGLTCIALCICISILILYCDVHTCYVNS